MKVLRKNASGKEVKILQGWLSVLGYYSGKVDGGFGPVTEQAVRIYQKAHGLTVDGVAGPATQSEMGFVPVNNGRIMVLRIPFSKIDKAGVLLKDKHKCSVESLAHEFGMNVVVNGGFFSRDTLQNVTDLVIKGTLNNGGNYTNTGLAFGNDFKAIGAYPSTTANCLNKPVDFMGGVPTLIQNGKRHVEMKGIPQSIYTQVNRRMCTGVTANAFYILTTLSNCSLEAMLQEGLHQGLLFLKGNDGGGSQSMYLGSDTVILTDGRAIPSAEGLRVRREI